MNATLKQPLALDELGPMLGNLASGTVKAQPIAAPAATDSTPRPWLRGVGFGMAYLAAAVALGATIGLNFGTSLPAPPDRPACVEMLDGPQGAYQVDCGNIAARLDKDAFFAPNDIDARLAAAERAATAANDAAKAELDHFFAPDGPHEQTMAAHRAAMDEADATMRDSRFRDRLKKKMGLDAQSVLNRTRAEMEAEHKNIKWTNLGDLLPEYRKTIIYHGDPRIGNITESINQGVHSFLTETAEGQRVVQVMQWMAKDAAGRATPDAPAQIVSSKLQLKGDGLVLKKDATALAYNNGKLTATFGLNGGKPIGSTVHQLAEATDSCPAQRLGQ